MKMPRALTMPEGRAAKPLERAVKTATQPLPGLARLAQLAHSAPTQGNAYGPPVAPAAAGEMG